MATSQVNTGNNSLNTLLGLGNLVQTITGSSSTTSSTTKGNISDEGVNRLLQQILAGRGGVKDISGAARGAGLYNSSTEAGLLNDLDVRAAGEVAARQAGTTTTQTTDTPGLGGVGLLKALAIPIVSGIAKPYISKALGIDSLLNPSAATSSTAAAGASGVAANTASIGAYPITGVASGVTGASTASGSGASVSNLVGSLGGLTPTAGVSLGDAGSLLGGVGSSTGSLAGDLGLANADSLSSTVGEGTTAIGGGALSGAGSVLSGFLNGNPADPFGSPEAYGAAIAAGTVAGGPIGGLIAAAGTVLGAAVKDASVICTALQARGLLDKQKYEKGQEYISKINRRTKRGYYLWGTRVANKINAGSAWAISLSLPVAVSRTNLIADEGRGIKGLIKYLKYPLGTVTLFIGQPLCYWLGCCLELADSVEDYLGVE